MNKRKDPYYELTEHERKEIMIIMLKKLEKTNKGQMCERRTGPQYHWVGDRRRAQQSEGPFPELSPRLLATIIGCVTWVLTWSLFFLSKGWGGALLLTPIFVAWVFFVLFFRGLKLRLSELYNS
jgi:hypothetical protein